MNPSSPFPPFSPAPFPALTLEHAGKTHTLYKHPREVKRYKLGQLTPEQLRFAPWYLRLNVNGKRRPFKLSADDRIALADARDKLNGQTKQPEQFAAWLAEKAARRGLTVSALATAWLEVGCPFNTVRARTGAEAEPLIATLTRAREWWDKFTWLSIKPQTLEEFVVWRRQQVRARFGEQTRFTGDRSADLELAALSCLGQWAVLTGRVEKNPFEKRPRFQDEKTIRHCHQAMPDNDEQFHRLLTWLFTYKNDQTALGNRHRAADVDRNQILAGGCLCFMALTGLRPGEPEHLQRVPAVLEFPDRLSSAAPGLIYPLPDGTRRMKVHRLKRGQNPAILIHPVLSEFLTVWELWLDATSGGASVPASLPLFPIRSDLVAQQLTRVCEALNLPPMKAHGFGRAYYVRVRRSQGADDATIAVELGQSSDGDLIRSVYGDPGDGVGGNLHDWLPKATVADGKPVAGIPAWQLLREQIPANLLNIKFG